jgi:putative transposase
LKEAERARNFREVCRLHNSTEQTFDRWRNKFGGMDVSEVKKLRELGRENTERTKSVSPSLPTSVRHQHPIQLP